MWMGWRQAYSLRAAAVWAALVLVMAGAAVPRAWAAVPEGGVQGRLVSVGWLQAQLAQQPPGAHTLRVLDASPAPQHRQGHIPGAVNADLFSVGLREVDLPRMQRRLRGWGLSPGQRIVIVDAGGTYMAPRLFWELLHFGVPAEQLFILDGGMARWRAAGGAVTTEATPPPPAGTVAVSRADDTVRVRLPEFLAATADPRAHVLLEALDPEYYFGATGFFNRPGHVSHATLMPADDFFNSDKTFKSPQQLQAMLQHLGVQPSQEVLT
jgi:3-mercaptopyruvate sulfurtransferase SseA